MRVSKDITVFIWSGVGNVLARDKASSLSTVAENTDTLAVSMDNEINDLKNNENVVFLFRIGCLFSE
ncbi:hypothetical protein VSWAT3_22145 [Vibrionales bacterium SWAT-3]|nr:hypothetical protein VSWAT3_22145 [Vibrionales bacterium SWAT-3]